MSKTIRRHSHAIVRACASVETLERRTLLASALIESGVLTVQGNTTADVISIAPASGGQVTVTLNGSASNFNAAAFNSILVNALGGNDSVTLANTITKPATLRGGGGNDSLVGGGGNDLLDGGTGSDTLKGGAGNDTADYSYRTENLHIGLGTLADDGAAGEKDNVWNDIETVLGGSGNDTLKGTAANNLLVGNAGNDYFQANWGNDTVLGGVGDDTLHGDSDHDSLVGGDGNDYIEGYQGNDTIDGGDGNDTLSGHFGHDSVAGGAGDDLLHGGDGDDTLVGGPGTDTLNGGDGTDTGVDVAGDFLISIENTIFSGGEGSAVITPDRTLLITGSDGADTIIVGFAYVQSDYGNVVVINGVRSSFRQIDFDRIVVNALGGDDFVSFPVPQLGADHPFLGSTVNLGAGDDRAEFVEDGAAINGGDGNDSVFGTDGGGRFEGGAGIDYYDEVLNASSSYVDLTLTPTTENARIYRGTLIGNELDNVLQAGSESTILGNGGNDLLIGGSDVDEGAVSLDGGAGNDTLIAEGRDATLRGGEGHDSLQSAFGNDLLEGGAGDDILEGGYGSDTFKGGSGNDTVDYSLRSGNLTIGLGTLSDDGEAGEKDNVWYDIETVLGGSGNDLIKGHANNNRLVGNAGNDTLMGNYGNDTLVGGPGTDTLNGEAGTDTAQDSAGDLLISIENS